MTKFESRMMVFTVILFVAFISFVSVNVYQKVESPLGANTIPEKAAYDIVGSSANAVSLPRVIHFGNSTTTDSAVVPGGYLDGGATLIQGPIAVGGQDEVRLVGSFIGGTATSTVSIRVQHSYDGSTWYDKHASSTSPLVSDYATSTPISVSSPTGAVFDPGRATTTMALDFSTYGSNFVRFLFLADDLTTDPTDGVQAFIEVVQIEPIVR